MQVKTTMKHHLIPVRTPIIGKSTNNKCLRGCGEKGTLLHCLWDCKLVQPLWRIVWTFLKKLKIQSLYDPAISLLGIYLGKFIIQKDTCTPVFIAARMSTDRWIDKEEVILNTCTHSRSHSHSHIHIHGASLVAQTVKNLPAMQETGVLSLGQKDPLEKGMATLSSSIAWRIPWTEEP